MASNDLILPNIVDLIINVIIFFGDISIILATIRYKTLQRPCNYLIALNALADVFTQLSYYVFSFYLFSGILYTTIQNCVYWQLVPSFGGQWSMALTLAIGVDRMIGVVMPLRYHKTKTILYIPAIVSLTILYTMWYVYNANFLYIETSANSTVICFLTSVTNPGFYVVKNIVQGIVCGAILIAYSITWIVLLKKKNVNNNLKQILKPLTIIMSMVVFAWPLTILLVTLARQFVPPDQTLTVILYIVWITNFGKASNYFIFFRFSKDYRRAFLKQLSWLPYFRKFVQPQVSLVQTVKKSITHPTQSLRT